MKLAAKITSIAATIALAAVSLTGCATMPSGETAEDQLVGQWVATAEGDVWCLVSQSSHGGYNFDCDWTTLTASGTHTTDDSKRPPSAWLFTERGEVFCLTPVMAYGVDNPDCNWDAPR